MAQICRICSMNSKQVRELEKDYMHGASKKSLSRKYNVSYDSVIHHLEHHMSSRMVKSFEKHEMTKDFNMMSEFVELMRDIKIQIEGFKEKEQGGLTLKAMDTLIRLYGVMSQFATAYFQKQANESQFQSEEEERQEQADNAKKLERLTPDELYELTRLTYKMNDMDWVISSSGLEPTLVEDIKPVEDIECLKREDNEKGTDDDTKVLNNPKKLMRRKSKRPSPDEEMKFRPVHEMTDMDAKILRRQGLRRGTSIGKILNNPANNPVKKNGVSVPVPGRKDIKRF